MRARRGAAASTRLALTAGHPEELGKAAGQVSVVDVLLPPWPAPAPAPAGQGRTYFEHEIHPGCDSQLVVGSGPVVLPLVPIFCLGRGLTRGWGSWPTV